jgi:hypothetical protein
LAFFFGLFSILFVPFVDQLLRLRLKSVGYALGTLLPCTISLAALGSVWWREPTLQVSDMITRHPKAIAFTIGTCVYPLLVLCLSPVVAITEAYKSRRQRENANATFVHLLLDLLRLLEGVPMTWQEPDTKMLIVRRLEGVASCVEIDLPWSIALVDPSAYSWFQETSRRKATAIRELKKWVLNPKADTYEHLVRKIADLFVTASRGDLDSLEMAPEEPVFTKAGIVKRLWSFIRALPTAGLPALLVWAFRKANLLSEPMLTYAIVGSFAWVCLTLASEFDPRFGDRLELFRKVTGLLRSGERKPETPE